jgi:cell division protein FtsW (lipid II flippase)
MISSVSIYASHKITSIQVAKGIIEEANNSFYLSRHIINALIALVVMTLVSNIPYTFFEKYTKYIFSSTLLILLLTFIP